MQWITPITDRTLTDVVYLQGIINRINTNGWDSLSEVEKMWWNTGNVDWDSLLASGIELYASDGKLFVTKDESPIKGAFNIIDINRVNNNCIYLKELLAPYGYIVTLTPIPQLNIESIPYMNGVMKILRDNVNAVVNAFYKCQNPPISYTNYFDYIMLNNLELNLKITNDLLVGMISLFPICGTLSCGESVL